MALDHYVSQVHLKNFYSPDLGGQTYAIRKSNLKTFEPRAADVCRIEEGNTNDYLTRDRAIEDFLKSVEPRYNAAIGKIRTGKIDQEAIHVVAGFAGYVSSCAPAAMRIHSGPLAEQVKETAKILDEQGVIPAAPEALGGKSISELLEDGSVKVTVDPKYPQALGIDSIIQRTSLWGNSAWEVLLNGEAGSSFFTSDYPVAIEPSDDPRVSNRIVPLTPDLAVRIMPDIRLSRAEPDLSFPRFSFKTKKLRHQDVRAVNAAIVRCAEDLVFFRDNKEWVPAFVKKNANYFIAAKTFKFPYGKGVGMLFSQRVVKRSDEVERA